MFQLCVSICTVVTFDVAFNKEREREAYKNKTVVLFLHLDSRCVVRSFSLKALSSSLRLNLLKEQSGFCVAGLDPELAPCMLGRYLFDVVGCSFTEPPQSTDYSGEENNILTYFP